MLDSVIGLFDVNRGWSGGLCAGGSGEGPGKSCSKDPGPPARYIPLSPSLPKSALPLIAQISPPPSFPKSAPPLIPEISSPLHCRNQLSLSLPKSALPLLANISFTCQQADSRQKIHHVHMLAGGGLGWGSGPPGTLRCARGVSAERNGARLCCVSGRELENHVCLAARKTRAILNHNPTLQTLNPEP